MSLSQELSIDSIIAKKQAEAKSRRVSLNNEVFTQLDFQMKVQKKLNDLGNVKHQANTLQSQLCQSQQQAVREDKGINIEQIVSQILQFNQITFIRGGCGSGKTTILSQIKDNLWLSNNDSSKYRVFPLTVLKSDLQNNQIDVYEILKKQENNSDTVLLNILCQEIQEQKINIVLLIDELDEEFYITNYNNIEVLFKKQNLQTNLSLVVATSDQIDMDFQPNYKQVLYVEFQPLNDIQIEKILIKYFQYQLKLQLKQCFIQQQYSTDIVNDFLEYIVKHQNEALQSENLNFDLFIQSQNFQEKEVSKIQQIIHQWMVDKPSISECNNFFDTLDIKNLVRIPEMLTIVSELIPNKSKINNFKEKYQFFNNLISGVIRKKLEKQNLEFNVENKSIQENLIELQNLSHEYVKSRINEDNLKKNKWHFSLMKHQQIINFFISKYIYEQLEIKLEQFNIDEQLKTNQTENFIKLRDQSLFGQIILAQDCFKGAFTLLDEKLEQKERIKKLLITIIKASSFIENFQQIAGNAFTILNNLDTTIIRGEDLSSIKILNSKIDKLQFYDCNFEFSSMNNVDITYTQFIRCKIEKVKWEIETKSEFFELNDNVQQISLCQFSPDGKILATVDQGCFIKLWCLQERKKIIVLQGCNKPIINLKFSIDGLYLVTVSQDQKIILWSLKQNKIIYLTKSKYIASENAVAAFSPDCLTLAASTQQFKIKIFNIKNRKLLRELNNGHEDEITTIQFSFDGSMLTSGSLYDKICLWNLKDGEILLRFNNRYTNKLVTLSQNCQYLAFSNKEHAIVIYSVKEKKEIKVLQGNTNQIQSLTFSPNQQLLASGGVDAQLRIWDIEEQNQIQVQALHPFEIKSVQFSQDGQYIASNGSKIRVQKINREQQNRIKLKQQSLVRICKFSTLEQIIAAVNENNQILIWCIKTNKVIKEVDYPQYPIIRQIEFSQNDGRLAFLKGKQTIYFWNIYQDIEPQELKVKTEFINQFKIQSLDSILATANSDNTIRLLNFQTGDEIAIFEGHTSEVKSIQFSQDSGILISGGLDQTIRLWSVQERKEINTFNLKYDSNVSVKVSPSGKLLAFSCQSCFICLFNIEELQDQPQFSYLQGHESTIRDIEFSPNGKILASSDSRHTIMFWNIEQCSQISQIQMTNQSKLSQTSISFSNDGLLFASSLDFAINLHYLKNDKNIQEYDENIKQFSVNQVLHEGQFLRNELKSILLDYNFEKIADFLTPYNVIAHRQLRVMNCLINNSQIFSIYGQNLIELFSS